MPLIVVSGLPGVGKSAVYRCLRASGRNAWGSDEDGFLVWKERATRQIVAAPEPFSMASEDPMLYTRVSRERVEELRARERANDQVVYLCGCAGHEQTFLELIDHLLYLVVDDDTLQHRLATRTDNNYGKSPEVLRGILEANRTWEGDYRRLGATIIDATPPLGDVVAKVVEAAEGGSA